MVILLRCGVAQQAGNLAKSVLLELHSTLAQPIPDRVTKLLSSKGRQASHGLTEGVMTQKVWMITGASLGFGAEIAKAVLATRNRVVGTARRLERFSAPTSWKRKSASSACGNLWGGKFV